jgi:hypothetical protein
MRPLKDTVPSDDGVLFVFYDFETTQNTRFSDSATLHVPNLVCVQQVCSQCENVEDGDCQRCGVRKHSFWEDPVASLLAYLCQSRPWVKKVVAIAHNAKAFDLHFILNRAVQLHWKPDLIMNGLKIMCMKMEHLVFLDSVSFLPFPLRKLPQAFGLTARKSWYPHLFNTEENLNYVGPIPDVSYYSTNEMDKSERAEFLAWYEGQRDSVFDTPLVLETYCQYDVTALRQACRVFKREFIQIGNIDVFQESITTASDCYKVLRRRFLKPDTMQSKKALMWLVHRERTDRCTILR